MTPGGDTAPRRSAIPAMVTVGSVLYHRSVDSRHMESEAPVDDVVERLQAAVGDGLRVVATGDLTEGTYTMAYLREDLTDLYSEDVQEAKFEDVLSEWYFDVGTSFAEELDDEKRATIRVFESSYEFTIWAPDLAFYVETDPDTRYLDDVLETFEAFYELPLG